MDHLPCIIFDFQCKRVRNGHIKNKYHIVEKWFIDYRLSKERSFMM